MSSSNNNASPNWGGKRAGAGRKHLFGEKLKPVVVRLPTSLVEALQNRGGTVWAREVLIRELKKEQK